MHEIITKLKRKGVPKVVRRKLMRTLVGKGISMAEIARALGISRQRVFQICQNVRADN